MLGRLRTVDARDERERAKRHPFGFRVCNHHEASHQDDVFGVPNFVHFAAGKTNDKWLKRATINPCLNGFGVHTDQFSTHWNVKQNNPLTTAVSGLRDERAKGLEPSTSSLGS